MSERQLVETVPERDDDDPEEPAEPHRRIVPACCGTTGRTRATRRGADAKKG
jgi:hypothetical protein